MSGLLYWLALPYAIVASAVATICGALVAFRVAVPGLSPSVVLGATAGLLDVLAGVAFGMILRRLDERRTGR